MRHNNRIHMDRYDRVYLDIPQCPWLRSIVAEPLKTIYYNSAARPDANIDKLFNGKNGVWDMEVFFAANGISLM